MPVNHMNVLAYENSSGRRPDDGPTKRWIGRFGALIVGFFAAAGTFAAVAAGWAAVVLQNGFTGSDLGFVV